MLFGQKKNCNEKHMQKPQQGWKQVEANKNKKNCKMLEIILKSAAKVEIITKTVTSFEKSTWKKQLQGLKQV